MSDVIRHVSSPRAMVAFFSFAMEAVLLGMVSLSPWALGSVDPSAQSWLLAGVALLLILWSLRMLVEWRVSWKTCPVGICISATVLLMAMQLVPLPSSLLGSISPGTSRIYSQLLPLDAEVLQQGDARESLTLVDVGSTISLYPAATRQRLIRLLALLVLFLIVRNNLSSLATLRRLSFALLINGSALALFGLFQHFSSAEPGTVFWTYNSSGAVFGPFINRNHFAFYINLCVGLGLGLLLVRRRGEYTSQLENETSIFSRVRSTLYGLLHDPLGLWISAGLAIMLTSVVFCLSRGGFLAMLGAATVCICLTLFSGGRNFRLLALLLGVAASLALLIWFGLGEVEARLTTIFTGEATHDGRVYLLTHFWPFFRQFPLFGTGYGTFQFVEPMYLHTAQDFGKFYDHAHNDYLEDLIEGGAIGLIIRLLAIGLIFRFAYYAFLRRAGTTADGLALGLLFGFTSITIHSFFEFGLFVPAIAVLAIVLIAHICSAGDCTDEYARDARPRRLGNWQATPLFGAICALCFAWFLYGAGSKAATFDHLRTEARGLRRAATKGLVERAAEIPLLEQMIRLEPSDAERRFVLAEAYLDVYQLDSTSTSPLLIEAMRQMVCARNLCPLLPEPHARIAAYVEVFAQADPRGLYLDRAKFLAPADPQLWYLCGVQELEDNQLERAWLNWKQSLKLSDLFLARILDRAATHLSGDELLEKILPAQADVLLKAAKYLYPQPEAQMDRKPLMEHALDSLRHEAHLLSPAQWHTKALIHQELGQSVEALQAYKTALNYKPSEIGWRYELALQLYENGQRQQASRELSIILGQQPNHAEALRLCATLASDATNRP